MSMNRPTPPDDGGKGEQASKFREFLSARRQAGFVTLTLPGDDRGSLEWSARGQRRRADVDVQRHELSDGGVDLELSPWPEELRPLVVQLGVPGICRIKSLSGRIDERAVKRRAAWGESRRVDDDALVLSADDGNADDAVGDDDGDDAVGQALVSGEIEFDRATRLLTVRVEPGDDNADPGMVRVELKWKSVDGDEQFDRFTIELSDSEDDDYWIGEFKIDHPRRTFDGRIDVTVRSLTAEELIDLGYEEREDEPSEVDRMIARSRFELHRIDVDKKTKRCVIGGLPKHRLDKGSPDLILMRANVVSGDESHREGVAGDKKSAPFDGGPGNELESLLRRYRDEQHGQGKMTEGERNLLFEKLYRHFEYRFPSWSRDQYEEAFGKCVQKLCEGKLPEQRDGERLVGYLKVMVDNFLKQENRTEKRRKGVERNHEAVIDAEQEDAEPHGTAQLESQLDDRLLEVLTPEECGYVAMRDWLEFKDVEIQEIMRLSEWAVRTLAERIERKAYILRGLDWLDRNCRSPEDRSQFTPRERSVVERYEFDGMSAEDATRVVGVVGTQAAAFRRNAVNKVELAAAADSLNVAEGDHPKVFGWFAALGQKGATEQHASDVIHLGRRLHGQVVVATLSRKRLTLVCRKWIELRMIKRKTMECAWSQIAGYQDWDDIKENLTKQSKLLNDVVNVWNKHKTAVPESIRTIDEAWLRSH